MSYIVEEEVGLHYEKGIPKNVLEFARIISNAPKQFDTRFIESRRPREVGIYYMSEAWYCQRRGFYTFFDKEGRSPDNPDDVALFRFAESGNIHHEHVSKAIEYVLGEIYDDNTMPVSVLPERSVSFIVDLEQMVSLHGRVDNLIFFPEASLLVEVKTRANVRNMESPTQHHVPQLQLYMAAFGAKYGMFIYEARDNLETVSFLIKRDDELIIWLIERIKKRHNFILAKMLPPAESKMPMTRRAWECGFCKYSEKCEKAEKKMQKDAAKKKDE